MTRRRGSGGGMHSILLLPIVAICLDTIDVCISVVVTVWGTMVYCVVAVVKDSGF